MEAPPAQPRSGQIGNFGNDEKGLAVQVNPNITEIPQRIYTWSDGGYREDAGQGGAGWIMRQAEHPHEPILYGFEFLPQCYDALEAETKGFQAMMKSVYCVFSALDCKDMVRRLSQHFDNAVQQQGCNFYWEFFPGTPQRGAVVIK